MCLCCCRCYVLDLAEKIILRNWQQSLDTFSYSSSDPISLSNFFMRLYYFVAFHMILENNRMCNDFSMHVIGSVLSA